MAKKIDRLTKGDKYDKPKGGTVYFKHGLE